MVFSHMIKRNSSKQTVFSISHNLLGQAFTHQKCLKNIQIPVYEPLPVSLHENDIIQCRKDVGPECEPILCIAEHLLTLTAALPSRGSTW